MCSRHSETKQIKTLEFGAEKGLFQGHARRPVAHTRKNTQLLKGFQQDSFKSKVRVGVVSCFKLLSVLWWLQEQRILCSCSCPARSGQDVPVNLQQDKCNSLSCNFLSLYEWILKSQSPENRLSCIFQAIGNVLLQMVPSPHD